MRETCLAAQQIAHSGVLNPSLMCDHLSQTPVPLPAMGRRTVRQRKDRSHGGDALFQAKEAVSPPAVHLRSRIPKACSGEELPSQASGHVGLPPPTSSVRGEGMFLDLGAAQLPQVSAEWRCYQRDKQRCFQGIVVPVD
mmetsp:Transcript_101001/g.182272  ORF Transcript_101001/g.182272 Transcript_101001/m.182272 type:complete len:139 (-) Transcript_101001:501-917(-)